MLLASTSIQILYDNNSTVVKCSILVYHSKMYFSFFAFLTYLEVDEADLSSPDDLVLLASIEQGHVPRPVQAGQPPETALTHPQLALQARVEEL